MTKKKEALPAVTGETLPAVVVTTGEEVESEQPNYDGLILDADGLPKNDFYHTDGVIRTDLPDGIYIGMDDSVYFAQERLGSTDFKILASDEAEDWFYGSRYNPDRDDEEKDTEDRVFGRALHAYVLEGKVAFESRFVPKPATYPGPKGEDKKWNANANYCKAWEAEQKLAGKAIMDAKTFRTIEGMALLIQKHPQLGPYLDPQQGLSEVVVLLTVAGIKCRVKMDKLMTEAILDLKSQGKHKASMASPVWLAEKGITRDTHTCLLIIRNMGYYIQRYFYSLGRTFMRDMIREHTPQTPRIYDASPGQLRFLNKVAAKDTWDFVYFFYRKVNHSRKSPSAPIVTPIVSKPGDLFDQRGYEKFELALKQYQELVERFSFDIPWARVNAAVEVSDELLNDIIGPTHEAKAEYKHEGAESSAVQDDEADEEA